MSVAEIVDRVVDDFNKLIYSVIEMAELLGIGRSKAYELVRSGGLAMPQRPDVDQIKKAWALKREGGMSQQAVAEELGLHPRTVSNYFRSSWLAQRNLGHLRFAGQEPQIPRSALENRAWQKCEGRDHSWMPEDLYRGHAYTESDSTEEMAGFDGSTLRNVYSAKTCNYCGWVMNRKRHGFVLT